MYKTFIIMFLSVIFFSCSKKSLTEENVLNVYLEDNITTTDPLGMVDAFSTKVGYQIYESLYEYHYLNYPYQVTPLLAEKMPEISNNGLVYKIRLKKGIEFIDDPCFKVTNGKGRELVADDFVYTIKRYITSPLASDSDLDYFLTNIEGLEEYRKKALSKEGFDNSTEMPGVRALDKYTIEIKLKRKNPYFTEVLVRSGSFVVAKEAVDYYGSEFGKHPVGTGPFILKNWEKGSKLVFVKNPKYKHSFYPTEGTPEDIAKGNLKDAGKPLPIIDKLVMHILPEEEPRWLNFKHAGIDIVDADKDNYFDAFPFKGELSDELKKAGVKVFKQNSLSLRYIAFNMKDKIVGTNKYLRQAISSAFNFRKQMDLFYNNQAVLANWLIPPEIFGFDPEYKNPYQQYDIEKAKRLLKLAGYPNGEGLPPILLDVLDTTTQRQFGEFFVKSANEIGINIKLRRAEYYALLRARIYEGADTQMFHMGWIVDFVRPENFLMLLRTNSNANHSKFSNREYDKLFDEISQMEDGAEKIKKIKRMRDISVEETVILPLVFPIKFRLVHSYVENYKTNPLFYDNYKYVRVNNEKKKEVLKLFSKQ